jgi:hypothetical protein
MKYGKKTCQYMEVKTVTLEIRVWSDVLILTNPAADSKLKILFIDILFLKLVVRAAYCKKVVLTDAAVCAL